jgi:hypothetical protein
VYPVPAAAEEQLLDRDRRAQRRLHQRRSGELRDVRRAGQTARPVRGRIKIRPRIIPCPHCRGRGRREQHDGTGGKDRAEQSRERHNGAGGVAGEGSVTMRTAPIVANANPQDNSPFG